MKKNSRPVFQDQLKVWRQKITARVGDAHGTKISTSVVTTHGAIALNKTGCVKDQCYEDLANGVEVLERPDG